MIPKNNRKVTAEEMLEQEEAERAEDKELITKIAARMPTLGMRKIRTTDEHG